MLRTFRYVGVVLVLAGVVVGLSPTLGFTMVTADRGVSVATADDGTALIALEATDGTVTDGEVVAKLRNNAGEQMDVTYQISTSTDDLTADPSDGETTLSPNGGELAISLACKPGNRQGTAQLQVTVLTADGATVSVSNAILTVDVSYDCPPGNRGPPPGKGQVFNDKDNDGVYDPGETNYTADELQNYDNSSADLVINDAGTIDLKGKQVSVKAETIRVQNTTLKSNKQITLDGDGAVDISTARLESNKQITVSGAAISGAGTTISTNKQIDIDAQGAVDISSAQFDTNKEISVTGSVINARGAVFDTNKDISMNSDSSITLKDATLTTNKEVSASLGTRLLVDGLSISDKDDVLRYSGGNDIGTPDEGSVAPS